MQDLSKTEKSYSIVGLNYPNRTQTKGMGRKAAKRAMMQGTLGGDE